MYGSGTSVVPAPRTRQRVRHGVRDGLAVMAFSAAASIGLAMVFLLLARIAVGVGS